MTRSAKTRVKLDTRPAKERLREIGKEGKAAAGRVNESVNRGRLGFGHGFGLGAAAAIGVGAARRAGGSMFGAIGDHISNLTAGTRAVFDAGLGGPTERGKKQAREETANAWAEIVARTGDAHASNVRNYYNQIKELRVKTEQGRNAVEQILTRSGKPLSEDDPLDKVLQAIIDAIKDGFGQLIDRLLGFEGK